MIACGTVAPGNERPDTTAAANTPSLPLHHLAGSGWTAGASYGLGSRPRAGVSGTDRAGRAARLFRGDSRRLSGDVRPARAGVGGRTDRPPDPLPPRHPRLDPGARLHPGGHRIRVDAAAG